MDASKGMLAERKKTKARRTVNWLMWRPPGPAAHGVREAWARPLRSVTPPGLTRKSDGPPRTVADRPHASPRGAWPRAIAVIDPSHVLLARIEGVALVRAPVRAGAGGSHGRRVRYGAPTGR